MVEREHIAILDIGLLVGVNHHRFYLIHSWNHVALEHLLRVLLKLHFVGLMVAQEVTDGYNYQCKLLGVYHEVLVDIQSRGSEFERDFVLAELPHILKDKLVYPVQKLYLGCWRSF